MNLPECIVRLQGKLVVSCQAFEGEPLYGSSYMVAMAKAAQIGGAGGIRANGVTDIQEIKASVSLPVIGINKTIYEGYEPYITPTMKEAQELVEAGADIVAIDATARVHPGGIDSCELIRKIKQHLGIPLMADVSTLEEALEAEEAGADMVGTTLHGYTAYTKKHADDGPAFELLDKMVDRLKVPVMAEGRIWYPDEAAEALRRGAFAVTVGGAITRPQLITRRFVERMQMVGRNTPR